MSRKTVKGFNKRRIIFAVNVIFQFVNWYIGFDAMDIILREDRGFTRVTRPITYFDDY